MIPSETKQLYFFYIDKTNCVLFTREITLNFNTLFNILIKMGMSQNTATNELTISLIFKRFITTTLILSRK